MVVLKTLVDNLFLSFQGLNAENDENLFLDASTHLYMSVGPSVRPSVVGLAFFVSTKFHFDETISLARLVLFIIVCCSSMCHIYGNFVMG